MKSTHLKQKSFAQKICLRLVAATALLVGTLATSAATTATAKTLQTNQAKIDVTVLTNGLNTPWGMDFLPNGDVLITERDGNLRRYSNGTLSAPLSGVPRVFARGQGGLLDVAVDPDFSDNQMIYLSFAEPGDGGAGTAVARGKLGPDGLTQTTVIYRQSKKTPSTRHFGSRLVFADDKTLFVTHGDRADRPRSQDPFDHAGSVVRINRDGSIPADNPFADGKDALPEIWSIGHRNAQGATLHPQTRELWTVEHGARGGDEINIPAASKNYGWPIISYGRHYSGFKIGEGSTKDGLEQPAYYWDPSIAPSGMAFYTGDLFPEWEGDLFVGALKFRLLVRLEMEGERIVGEERILEDDYGRIRDVRSGPDGALYLLTDDSEGLLIRITPAS